VRGYSFRAILRQSSQRLSANCCPRSGTASQIRQTHPLSRHRFVHTSSFSRSASSVTTKEYSSIPGAVHTLPKADLIVRFLESLPEFLHWFEDEQTAGPESAYNAIACEIWEKFVKR